MTISRERIRTLWTVTFVVVVCLIAFGRACAHMVEQDRQALYRHVIVLDDDGRVLLDEPAAYTSTALDGVLKVNTEDGRTIVLREGSR